MVWRVEIERVPNGYVIIEENDEEVRPPHVIEDDENDELKSHQELLWVLMEIFGDDSYGSKHDPERIRVVRETNSDFQAETD